MKLPEIKKTNKYSALVLTEATRLMLQAKYYPKYPEFIGHHITLKFGLYENELEVPSKPSSVRVVGYVDDGSLEGFLVELDGNSKRPDGSLYHITWSLDRSKGRKPVDTNKVIDRATKIPYIDVSVVPKILP